MEIRLLRHLASGTRSRQRRDASIGQEPGSQKTNFHFFILVGTRRPIVEEPLAWAEEYPIQWREQGVDLAELAKLRWITGLSRKELAEHFDKTECAIQNYFQDLRRRGFRVPGLSAVEQIEVIRASKRRS